MNWIMEPGRVYTINVGAWVFCEAHGGTAPWHSSTAWARLNAEMISITAGKIPPAVARSRNASPWRVRSVLAQTRGG